MVDQKPLGVTEAAEFLWLSKNYLYKLIHLRRIPYYKPTGGRVFFRREELEEFIYRGKVSADYELQGNADHLLNGVRK